MAKETNKTATTPENAVADKEKELTAREEALLAQEEELTAREEALLVKEEALKKLAGPTEEKQEKTEGFEFSFRDKKYKFIDDAPRTIRVMGEVMTQEEIAEDEDVLVHLIGGNAGLIEKLK